MASFLRSNFGFEFGAKVCLFWSLWQVIPDWLVLEATGCEQRELSLLCCGSTSMIPAAKLWNKFLATGCSMTVYPWIDPCCLPGFKTMQRNSFNMKKKTVYDLWFWHDDARRESRASLVEEWNFMLTYTSVVRASVEGLAGTFIGRSFFWRRGISFGFGQFVSLSTEAIFLVSNSGRPLLLFH